MFSFYPFLSKIFYKRFYTFPEKACRNAAIALTYACQENCEYCFAKNLSSLFPSYITVEDFNKSLQWLTKQGFYFIALGGGEPTDHPQFPEICNIISAAAKNNPKLRICLMTKRFGLKHIFDNIAEYKNNFIFQVNLSGNDLNSMEKLETLSCNSRYIKGKRGYICIRTVLQDENDDNFQLSARKLIDFASLHKLNLRFSFDSCMRITENTMIMRAKRTVSFIENCIKMNIRAQSVRSIPSCFFDRIQLKKYSNYLLFNCFQGMQEPPVHFYINPNLSSFMCCSAHYKIKNILQYKTIYELIEKYRTYLAGCSFEPIFERCAKCDKFKKRLCFGGCFGHRGGTEKIINI